MSEGHIRAFRTNRADLPGVSELMIYPPLFMQSDNNGGARAQTADSR